MSQSITSSFPNTLSSSAFIKPRTGTSQIQQRQVSSTQVTKQPGQSLQLRQTTLRSSSFVPPPRSTSNLQSGNFQANNFNNQLAINRYRTFNQQAELSSNAELVRRIDTRI